VRIGLSWDQRKRYRCKVRDVSKTNAIGLAGRIAKLVKALDHRPKGTGFDPRLDHNKHST
jgi:hypothetical protein